MSLVLAFVLFFFFIAFYALHIAFQMTREDQVFFKLGLFMFSFVIVYYSSSVMVQLAYYTGLSQLTDLMVNTNLIMVLCLFFVTLLWVLQFLLWGLNKANSRGKA